MENKTTTTKIIDHNGKRPKKTNNNFWYKLNVHDTYKRLHTYNSTSKQHCVEQKKMLISYVFTFVVVLLNVVHPVLSARRHFEALEQLRGIGGGNRELRLPAFDRNPGIQAERHRHVRGVASWQ